jgi:cytidyltransferase-like protein
MIIHNSELSNIRRDAADASVALRFGCYDLLHNGHRAGIDYAAALADILVIGVMPDAYVTREKGPDRPIRSESDRISSINSAEGVDYTFITPPTTFGLLKSIFTLKPDVYVEEDEHTNKVLKTAVLKTIGVELVIDSVSRLGSTSAMIENLGLAEATMQSSLSYQQQQI